MKNKMAFDDIFITHEKKKKSSVSTVCSLHGLRFNMTHFSMVH